MLCDRSSYTYVSYILRVGLLPRHAETPVRSTYIQKGVKNTKSPCAHTSIQLTDMSQRVSDKGIYSLSITSKLRRIS